MNNNMSIHDQGKAKSTQKTNNGLNFIGNGNKEEVETQGLRQLRRMPHVFCKLLDLPFAIETDVKIEERRESYEFVIRQPGLQEADVVMEVVQIVPGAIKLMLQGAKRIRAGLGKSPSMEMGNWRARLPACTVPEAATSTYADGIITITIPKLLPATQHLPTNRSPCSTVQDMKRSLLCSNAY